MMMKLLDFGLLICCLGSVAVPFLVQAIQNPGTYQCGFFYSTFTGYGFKFMVCVGFKAHLHISREATCRSYLCGFRFLFKVGEIVRIPELGFFLVAVKSWNRTMCFRRIARSSVVLLVHGCKPAFVLICSTMSRGNSYPTACVTC